MLTARFSDELFNYWDTNFTKALLTFNGNTEADLIPSEMRDPRFRRLVEFASLVMESVDRSISEWEDLGFSSTQLMALFAIFKANRDLVAAGTCDAEYIGDRVVFSIQIVSA